MLNLKTKRVIATLLSEGISAKVPICWCPFCGIKVVRLHGKCCHQMNPSLLQNLSYHTLKRRKLKVSDELSNEHLLNLLRASRAISKATDYQILLQAVTTAVIELSEAKQALMLIPQGNSLILEAKARTTPEGIIFESVNSKVNWDGLPESFINTLIQTQEPIYIYFKQQETLRKLLPNFKCASGFNALCLPIVNNSKLIAIFYVELNLKSGHLNDNKLNVLKSVATHAAAAIELMNLQSRINELDKQHQQLEYALRLADKSLALGEQTSRTGSWRWELQKNMLICSEEFCHIFDLDHDQRIIHFDDFAASIHPDDKKSVLDRIHYAVQMKTPINVDYRIVKADGNVLYLTGQGCPVFDTDKLVDYVGTVNDVTAQRASENALRAAQDHLARVSRITTIGQLTSSIAHEINQPLMSIVTNAGAGLRWLHQHVPDLQQVSDSLQSIATEGQRAGQIVQSLRTLTKNTKALLSVLDIHDVLKCILSIARCEIERRNVLLELNLNAKLSHIRGDMVQLQQVMLNLLMNAIEAMNEISNRPKVLTISTFSDDEKVIVVNVEDTGSGISDEVKYRLFDAFYTTKKEGMGMGLAICQSIVDMHGGELSAAQRQPVGSVFSFSIPLVKD